MSTVTLVLGGPLHFMKASLYLGLDSLELNLFPEHLSILIKFSRTAGSVEGSLYSQLTNSKYLGLLLSAWSKPAGDSRLWADVWPHVDPTGLCPGLHTSHSSEPTLRFWESPLSKDSFQFSYSWNLRVHRRKNWEMICRLEQSEPRLRGRRKKVSLGAASKVSLHC